jgi:3-hydroxyacyl-[acyl-carrier-protein] dehydratase
MLQGDFYSIQSDEEISSENHRFQIEINPNHPIFPGHFPGQPVLPGVCLIQIGKELIENIVHRKLFLHKGSNIKFLNVVDPRAHPIISFDIKIRQVEIERVNVDIVIYESSTTFVKFSGQLG